MMSLATVALASIIACLREPAPESELLTTVKVAGTTRSSRPRSSSLRRIPFFDNLFVVLVVKRFLKALKNIGGISFNQKQFNCITVKSRIQQHYRYKASTKRNIKQLYKMLLDKNRVSIKKQNISPILPILNKRLEKKRQKHLPRNNTEFHGKDRSIDTERRASRSERLAPVIYIP